MEISVLDIGKTTTIPLWSNLDYVKDAKVCEMAYFHCPNAALFSTNFNVIFMICLLFVVISVLCEIDETKLSQMKREVKIICLTCHHQNSSSSSSQ